MAADRSPWRRKSLPSSGSRAPRASGRSHAEATAGRRSGDEVSVEARDAGGDDRAAVVALSLGGGLLAAAVPLARVGGGLDQCGCERLFVVGGCEPAALAVADDLGRAVRIAGDHG